MLILNKKSIANQESQLFKAELEKFRPHQNRILQANHKQASLLKELTRTYSDLLKDPRVRSEQSKYDTFSRQRSNVMSKYKRVYQSYNDLNAGLIRAQGFYSEMKDTVSSLQKNVETFVNNRRSEGGQLLQNIEQKKSQGADHEQQRLKDLMERMSMEPSGSPVSVGSGRKKSIPAPLSSTPLNQPGYPATSAQPSYSPVASPPVTPRYPMTTAPGQPQYMSPQQQPYGSSNGFNQQQQHPPRRESYQTQAQQQHPSHHQSSNSQSSYNPTNYGPVSPPAHQQYFSPPPNPHNQQQAWGQPPHQHQQPQQYGGYQSSTTPQPGLPQGYVPPPPPPGPPPAQHPDYAQYGQAYPSGPGGYAAQQQQQQQRSSQQGQQQGGDPWAGLSGWK